MSVEYYLSCKKKFENIITNLTEIIENYENIFSYTEELDIVDAKYFIDKFQLVEFKSQFNARLNYANHCKNYCNRKIRQICAHEFINDTIDIDPDRSQNITYCKICEYTIPN